MSGLALDPTLLGVLRGSLALLFALAALHKLRDLRGFTALLADYRLLPTAAAAPVAPALALAELAIGVALCTPTWGPLAARAAALLLALYAGAIAANLARGRRAIDCGCGLAPRPLDAGLVVRNALLVGAALVAALPASPRALVWVDALSIGFGIATAACLFAAADAVARAAARSHA
jgi:hypothetical protein